jgi:hypothetical protein
MIVTENVFTLGFMILCHIHPVLGNGLGTGW